jgi:UDP:flavonoid glycosyltransferase YjiC (YdhE family)
MWADDLGLPTRSIPVALELQHRGHKVAFCEPENAPAKVVEEAGLTNLQLEIGRSPEIFADSPSQLWDLDHLTALVGNLDQAYVLCCVKALAKLIEVNEIDVVVDSFNPTACLAARVAKKSLVTIIQADLHPANSGFVWWEEKPGDIPTSVPVFNSILSDHGLEPISTASELVLGDLTLCAGTPETDPIPGPTEVIHMGPMFNEQSESNLPDWLEEFVGDKPLIWVYCGNPRYAAIPWADSIVVLKAALDGLAGKPVRVIITAGHHAFPDELPPIPDNFHREPFLPGLSLARRSDLIIHHGGHGSCMVGATAGTPALIIPTVSERESNARHFAALGVAKVLMPVEYYSGEKHLSGSRLWEKVESMLTSKSCINEATVLSEKMQEFGGTKQVADHIERLI